MTDIRIKDYSPDMADEVLGVINDAFGTPRSSAWFRWKHVDGPWGPSRGAVALDDQEIVGVRLLLPWRFRRGEDHILAYRAVEASTTPRARGRGVFTLLNRHVMECLADEPEPTFIFSTPNSQSRDGYRKLGWTWLEPVEHAYRMAPKSLGRVDADWDADALSSFGVEASIVHGHRLGTSWTPEAIRWRLDPRTGNDYRLCGLTDSEGAGGIAYRTDSHQRVRVLVVIAAWGPPTARRMALAEARRREGPSLVLDVSQTEHRLGGRLALRRGASLLATWTPESSIALRFGQEDVANWRVSFADLESVL